MNKHLPLWAVLLILILVAWPALSFGASSQEFSGLMAEVPPAKAVAITPQLRDDVTTADAAYNYQGVMDNFGLKLSPAQRSFLDANKFLLIPVDQTGLSGMFNNADSGYVDTEDPDQMLKAFGSIGGIDLDLRWPYQTKLVTPDIVLHAFFRFVQNSLKYVEKESLAPQLQDLLTRWHGLILAEQKSASPELKKRYQVILAQVTTALILIRNNEDQGDNLQGAESLLKEYSGTLSEEMQPLVKQELELIYQAEEVMPSPLFKQYWPGRSQHDYTMYTPRGHYTESGLMRAYFRTMTYLGRQGYNLNNQEGLQDALLVTHFLLDDAEVFQKWQRILAVTAFYAGQPDDVTAPVFRDVVLAATGARKLKPTMAVDQAALSALEKKVSTIPLPRILSEIIFDYDVFRVDETKLRKMSTSLRIFGQRFNLDAWFYGQLTQGSETSDLLLPRTPSALFIPAVYGDSTARDLCGQFILSLNDKITTPEELKDFYKVMDSLALYVKNMPDEEIFSSVGSAWLDVLGTLTGNYGPGYPLYMQSPVYPLKQLESFLGSYTEYKHAFQLYQKQIMVEKGAPGPPTQPPVPRGFVTPNLRFWYAFQRLIDYTEAGMANMGLMELELWPEGRLSRFKKTIAFFTRLAEKELSGERITDAEYEALRIVGLGYMAAAFDPTALPTPEDQRPALIVDIATVVEEEPEGNSVIYEATAKPYLMLVLVGNEELPRLAVGLAYNHYEFKTPLVGRRYTKQDWQWKVYDMPQLLPEKNCWYKPLLPNQKPWD